MNELFFALVRVSLGTEACLPHTPSPAEWEELYIMAKNQGLLGICFVGVQKLKAQKQCPLEDLYDRWMGMSATIQMKNKIVDKQCREIQDVFRSKGMRSCILKGQGVARLYGSILAPYRQSGDIDLWIDAPKEDVIDYVMHESPTVVFDQKHIHYRYFKDTDVEAHWIPVKHNNPFRKKVLTSYFNSERERQFSNYAEGLCYPTQDFQLVHQLLHVYGHYVYEGVGLRQVMDLYFAQMACKNEDYQAALTLFQRLHLMKYVAATQWVLQTVFHMTADKLLCSPDEKEGKKLLQEIMIGGNFGQHDERNHVEGETFLQRFIRRWARRFRMFRFDPLGTLVMPFTRIKLEIWMRKVRRKYGLTA